MAQKHWYHVYIDFIYPKGKTENKHIASFTGEDDAITFAIDTREYYLHMKQKCKIRILYRGDVVFTVES